MTVPSSPLAVALALEVAYQRGFARVNRYRRRHGIPLQEDTARGREAWLNYRLTGPVTRRQQAYAAKYGP